MQIDDSIMVFAVGDVLRARWDTDEGFDKGQVVAVAEVDSYGLFYFVHGTKPGRASASAIEHGNEDDWEILK
jgi:hypothetical protein